MPDAPKAPAKPRSLPVKMAPPKKKPARRAATMDDFRGFMRDEKVRTAKADKIAKAKAATKAKRAEVLRRRAANAKRAAEIKRKRAAKKAAAPNPFQLGG